MYRVFINTDGVEVSEAGAFPTYNFKEGQYYKASDISGETFADIETKRDGNPTHGGHTGCAIRCSGIYVDKNGNYITKQPEHETVWAHGGNCGINDPDAIATSISWMTISVWIPSRWASPLALPWKPAFVNSAMPMAPWPCCRK